MTDETRDEIVRLARKGWTVDKVASWLTAEAIMAKRPEDQVTVERVQAVVDEADQEVERTMTPSVPRRDDGREEWSVHVPAARLAGVHSSKRERWASVLQAAAEQSRLLWLAEQTVSRQVTWADLRRLYKELHVEWDTGERRYMVV